ncbi:MAG TPA: LLM class flavin-dependent oxidoreductase [Candidatus Limnocylindria bacterium]|nr:LLM class flavin-dependent oxidoreductase [Candidatus Limnocylindria bacterium]
MQRTGLVLHHGITSGAALARYGRIAEEHGYESLWVTERLRHEETFSLLGFLAASTTRVRLGVGVVNPYTRHPALIAMGAATLSALSGGRFVLGLGRSEREVIEGRLGLTYRAPLETLAAAVGAIRDQLGAACPPIYLAAIGRRALRLAGRIADGVLLNAYVPVGYVRWALGELRAGAAEAGRRPDALEVACMLVVRREPDAAAMQALRARVVRLLCEPHVGELLLATGGFDGGVLPRLRAAAAAGRDGEAEALVSDAMVDAFYLLGRAPRLHERLAAYRAAGVTLPLLLPPLADFAHTAETFAPAPTA